MLQQITDAARKIYILPPCFNLQFFFCHHATYHPLSDQNTLHYIERVNFTDTLSQ
jgi:hypothetical protein